MHGHMKIISSANRLGPLAIGAYDCVPWKSIVLMPFELHIFPRISMCTRLRCDPVVVDEIAAAAKVNHYIAHSWLVFLDVTVLLVKEAGLFLIYVTLFRLKEPPRCRLLPLSKLSRCARKSWNEKTSLLLCH